MKESIKSIESNKGLGELLFGMSREEVKALIGEPFEIEKPEEEDIDGLGRVEVWHYDQLEMSLGFEEEEDWALMSISITSGYYELGNISLIGKSLAEVGSELEKLGIINYETEDHSDAESPNHKLIVSDFLGMIIWFDNDVATEISWSPLYEEEEKLRVV